MVIGTSELYEGQFEEQIAELEAWHARRTSEGWVHPAKANKELSTSN